MTNLSRQVPECLDAEVTAAIEPALSRDAVVASVAVVFPAVGTHVLPTAAHRMVDGSKLPRPASSNAISRQPLASRRYTPSAPGFATTLSHGGESA